MTASQKQGCAETVSVPELMDSAELAFTGRVIKRDQTLTWFRIYRAYQGKRKGGIVKASGFFSRKVLNGFYAGGGQSYDAGEVFTVVLRRPETREEEKRGADFVNSLDHCQEAVISKIHNRYGIYRVTPDKLEPGFWQKTGNHWFHFKVVYLAFGALVVAAAGAFRFKSAITAFFVRLQKSA